MIYKYYFRASLKTHVHFYRNFIRNLDVIQKDISCSLSPFAYFHELVSKKNTDIKIHLAVGRLDFFYATLFFDILIHRKVVLHLKKVNVRRFRLFKKIFKERLVIIFEGEGDPGLEKNYITQYDSENAILADAYSAQESILRDNIILSDFLLYGNIRMVANIISGYGYLKKDIVCLLRPMTFSKSEIFIKEPNVALKVKLGFQADDTILLYSGNILYRWQCFPETVRLAEWIIRELPNVKLLVLTRVDDMLHAERVLSSSGISKNNYRIKNVDFRDMNDYLSISSFGFALRHSHRMNYCTPAAKIVEYAAAGVIPITTMAMGDYGFELRKIGITTVLDDVEFIGEDNMNALVLSVQNSNSSAIRSALSDWAGSYCYENTGPQYIEQLVCEKII
jgi:hypothetical protein